LSWQKFELRHVAETLKLLNVTSSANVDQFFVNIQRAAEYV